MSFPTRHGMARFGLLAAFGLHALLPATAALAQQPGAGPAAVGTTPASRRAVTQTNEFIGRIEAVERVDLQSRVTAFLNERLFEEGADVKQGDLLFRLESAPFEAQMQIARAAVAQAQAQLQNANLTLGRAQSLLSTPAGQRSTVDSTTAAARSAQAQLLSAQAQQQQAQISLDYAEIRAPISGRIGRASVTPGNVVTPSSGTLASIVTQDPMYVTFTVPVRTMLELRNRYGDHGGLDAVTVRVRLPDGRMYGQTGKLDFIDIDVGRDTDSITLRGRMPNPPLPAGQGGGRELVANQFVNVRLEAVEPVQMLVVPRAAVMTDQRGDFVYVIAAENKAERRGVRIGSQSTPEMAVIAEGLREGEQVVVEGVQRVRPGAVLAPAPITPPPGATAPGAATPAPTTAPPAGATTPGTAPAPAPAPLTPRAPAGNAPAGNAPAGNPASAPGAPRQGG